MSSIVFLFFFSIRVQKNVLIKQTTEDQHLAVSKTTGQTQDIGRAGKDIIINPLHRHRNSVPLLFSVMNKTKL